VGTFLPETLKVALNDSINVSFDTVYFLLETAEICRFSFEVVFPGASFAPQLSNCAVAYFPLHL